MRILQINKYYPPLIGGVESVVRDLSESLAADGWEVTTLICQAKTGVATTDEMFPHLHIHRSRTQLILFRLPLSFDFFRAFRREAKDTDIILLHHPFPLGFLAYAFFGLKKPLAVFYHSDIVKQKFLAHILQPLTNHILSRARTIFVTSKRLQTHSPVLSNVQQSCIVVPLWIHAKNIELSIKQQEHSQMPRNVYTHPLLLAVGRLVYYKGYSVLLDAMKNVRASLLIVGEGPDRHDLQGQIHQNQLADRVTIIPPVSDLIPYFHAADLFVFPSIQSSEAFGIVQLEAMACGLPVINTDLPTGVPEVSLDHVTGITVKPNDPLVLANAINELLTNTSLRNTYAAQAKKRSKKFEASKIIPIISRRLNHIVTAQKKRS